MSAFENETPVVLRLCATCETADFERDREIVVRSLREAELHSRVRVVRADCLGGCENPASLSLQSQGRASYVFSGIDCASDGGDIAATCQQYLEADTGWIVDARKCGRLRDCLRARIPALDA